MKQNKPKAQIIGADGNIFNRIGIASKALKKKVCTNKRKK